MCEFTVILDGEVVFKDAVYARMESNNVTLKDVLECLAVLFFLLTAKELTASRELGVIARCEE